MERHQSFASRVLHAVGIPMLIAGLVWLAWMVVFWQWDRWWRPVAVVLVSYVPQWLGHQIEGNDMGEVILIKKLMGRPYTAVSPRYHSERKPN